MMQIDGVSIHTIHIINHKHASCISEHLFHQSFTQPFSSWALGPSAAALLQAGWLLIGDKRKYWFIEFILFSSSNFCPKKHT